MTAQEPDPSSLALLRMTITVILRAHSARRISYVLITSRSFVAPTALLRMTSHTHMRCLAAQVVPLLRMTTCRAVLQCLSRKVTALLRMTRAGINPALTTLGP